jgi:hypothetical protein
MGCNVKEWGKFRLTPWISVKSGGRVGEDVVGEEGLGFPLIKSIIQLKEEIICLSMQYLQIHALQ